MTDSELLKTQEECLLAEIARSTHETSGGHLVWNRANKFVRVVVPDLGVFREIPVAIAVHVIHRGPVPQGATVYSGCGLRECIHPDHIYAVNELADGTQWRQPDGPSSWDGWHSA